MKKYMNIAYEIRYLDISGNIITKEEYDIIEEKYIAAFVGLYLPLWIDLIFLFIKIINGIEPLY